MPQERSEVNPLILLFLGIFGSSAPTECPAIPVIVAVEARLPGQETVGTAPRSELARMMKSSPYKGFAMQGLTVLDFSTTWRLEVALSEIAPGRWCASPERIEASFGLSDPAQVLIASELDPRSCAYRTVLAHERQHVEVGKRNARNGANAIRDALDKLATHAFPVESSTRDGAYARAKDLVGRTVDTVSADHVARADRENAAMDTVEEYRRLSAQCP